VGKRRRRRRGCEIGVVVLLHDLNLHHEKPGMDENENGAAVGMEESEEKEMNRSFE